MAIHPARHLAAALLALALEIPGSAAAADPAKAPALGLERAAGEVLAVQDGVYVLSLGGEPGIGPGTVLRAWRRLPSARGTAGYRDAELWWEVGQLVVRGVGDGVALASFSAPPLHPLPREMDESGAPPDLVQVGDRIRTSGAVAERDSEARVDFPRGAFFGPADASLGSSGESALRGWLRGLRRIEGPVFVEVHASMQELGRERLDVDQAVSASRDAPFGPSPATPVTPVAGLWQDSVSRDAVSAPPGRDLRVVEPGSGSAGTFHYLDPFTLAQRQGQRVAEALAAHLSIPAGSIAVRVVPHALPAEGESEAIPAGYAGAAERIRIVARAIDWSEPAPEPKLRAEPPAQDEPERGRRRRLLERPEVPVSDATERGGTDGGAT